MKWTEADAACMTRALELARRGRYSTHPNPQVGCVIAQGGRIAGSGWHHRAGLPHAEINALNEAGGDLQGATAYITLEPCNHHGRTPPCAPALIEAGLARVVVAMPDPNPMTSGRGLKALAAAGLKVETGLMAEEALAINRGFVSRMERRRPYIRCKLAVSVDGKTALANGASRWITGAEARADGQRLRAASSAVMTGINTVLADDPRLNVREVDTAGRQPLRVVLDRALRFPATARMVALAGKTLLFTRSRDAGLRGALERAGVEVRFVAGDEEGFLPAVLRTLALECEVNDLLVEAGPTLSGALLQGDLVDELIVYQAPILLGSGAAEMAATPVIAAMEERRELELLDQRPVGKDWRLTFRPLRGGG